MSTRLSTAVAFSLGCMLAAAAGGDGLPVLLGDLNPQLPGGAASSHHGILDLTALGDRVLFVLSSQAGGELTHAPWVSDGTAQGTSQLARLPGCCLEYPFLFGAESGTTYFLAHDFYHEGFGDPLWRTDGTSGGTVPLGVDFMDVGGSGGDDYLATSRGLFFTGCVLYQCGAYFSDGTAAGTRELRPEATPELWLKAGGQVLFASLFSADRGLYVTDGTAAGTRKVVDLPLAYSAASATAGGRAFFVLQKFDGYELWQTDGTVARTMAVHRAVPFEWSETPILPFGNGVVLTVDDGVWISDGTAKGTRSLFSHAPRPERMAVAGDKVALIAADGSLQRLWFSRGGSSGKPLVTGCPSGCPRPAFRSDLIAVGARFVFTAEDGEPWSSDGTPEGTRQLADVCPGGCGSAPAWRGSGGGLAYFVARPHNPGPAELWSTDGTPSGTRRVSVAVEPESDGTFAGGSFYFVGNDPVWGRQLWSTHGTPASTRQVTVIEGNGPASAPANFAAVSTGAVFSACAGDHRRFYRSDGTVAGTTPIVDPTPPVPCPSSPPVELESVVADDQLFFRRADLTSSTLWRVRLDGSGLVQLLSAARDSLRQMVHYGAGIAFLRRTESPSAIELWTSDGTLAGTRRKVTLSEQTVSRDLTVAGGRLFFVTGGSSGSTLWRSDGSEAGTVALASVGHADHFVQLGEKTFFLAGQRLWSTDGTAVGTATVGAPEEGVTELVRDGDALYLLVAASSYPQTTLYRSDGTAGGTVAIVTLPSAFTYDALAADLVATGGSLFFSASDTVHGNELWTSDGTAGGTRVLDLVPGRDSSYPRELTAVGGTLYFTSTDPLHGFELRRTDGTVSGTRLVQDLAPGFTSSGPEGLIASGDLLFLSADDGLHGREAWALSRSAAGGCVADVGRLCLQSGRYAVEATWRDFGGNAGNGKARPLTDDTGAFWFFGPDNVEVIVKVLDGSGVNGHAWVFFGALSSVEYSITVTDVATGASRRYVNPPGNLASVGDTQAFGPRGAKIATVVSTAVVTTPASSRRVATSPPCAPAATRLCLQGGRFAVEVAWNDGSGHAGAGQAVPLTPDTGLFWFFGPTNVELAVKLLDGRPVNGKFWVFFAALSDVEYTVTVTDTETQAQRIYRNPRGTQASVADTSGF